MKLPLLALVLAFPLVMAQAPLEEGEVVMINSKHPSEDCEGVMKRVGKPIFPTSTVAEHTLIRSGACSIELSYSLSEAGLIGDVETLASEDRCNIFVESAILALKRSSFNKQEMTKYCEYTYTFEME